MDFSTVTEFDGNTPVCGFAGTFGDPDAAVKKDLQPFGSRFEESRTAILWVWSCESDQFDVIIPERRRS
jgi:hypothetical protein